VYAVLVPLAEPQKTQTLVAEALSMAIPKNIDEQALRWEKSLSDKVNSI
jgi:hypothetical protein